ncbi:hypothetical protein SCP_1005130 [Sparassis crispa]|uniref:Uncharacterized protein n=1 Tax=Sparassis crispa TaxID=139825 RepID=A0A401GYM1_9APHY|nr:hypothetical protein SCP_1005130 [Sparassis crispa]GBE87266.1 hypothetical protein SCP_1005130 [Sparassis crispa]
MIDGYSRSRSSILSRPIGGLLAAWTCRCSQHHTLLRRTRILLYTLPELPTMIRRALCFSPEPPQYRRPSVVLRFTGRAAKIPLELLGGRRDACVYRISCEHWSMDETRSRRCPRRGADLVVHTPHRSTPNLVKKSHGGRHVHDRIPHSPSR